MSTLRQIEANRRNAAKSTGPRSVEGKAVSSMNALQSGIHAESSIITGEDPDQLAQLTESFYRDHQPATALERALLDNVIRDTWLLARFARIDAEIVEHQIHDTHYPCKDHPAGKAFMDTSTAQLRLQRRINDTRRSQLLALKEFQRLQAERRSQPAVPQPEPLDVTAVSSMPQEQIGFVSQPHPEAPESPSAKPIIVPPAAARPRLGFLA